MTQLPASRGPGAAKGVALAALLLFGGGLAARAAQQTLAQAEGTPAEGTPAADAGQAKALPQQDAPAPGESGERGGVRVTGDGRDPWYP